MSAPCRFNEWSQSIWAKQKVFLQGTGPVGGFDWHYLGFIVQDDHDDTRDGILAKLPNTMTGMLMQDRLNNNSFKSLFQREVPSL